MSAVHQILDAIHALPRGEQRRILLELVNELGLGSDSVPPLAANDATDDDGMIEERGRLLVYTGPVDAAAMDHRAAREDRQAHLSGNARRV